MKKKFNLTSVGGSSILTIFGVLMLIVFALLSLSTAKADRNLADRTWQAKEAITRQTGKQRRSLADCGQEKYRKALQKMENNTLINARLMTTNSYRWLWK